MQHIIFLFLFWLLLAYLFKSFTAATVMLVIILLAMIIWVFRSGGKKKNEEESNTFEVPKRNSNIKETKSVPSAPKRELYEVYHRPKDGFVDNMNYKLYRCKGTYIKTGRKRSLTIEAFDEDDALNQLRQQPDFIEPFEINRISFPELTDLQKDYLKNMDFSDVCKYDASAILSLKYDYDSVPNPELVLFATECHVKFSYYIGKRALYDLIFNSLELKDKIAFFAFCIFRYTSRDRRGNLNSHPYHKLFYDFAENNLTNESFIKSMNKYSGKELRFFGEHPTYGTGGSKNTIAYKAVMEFLKQQNLYS